MPNPLPLSGKLEENTLPGLLSCLYEKKNTGTLSVARDGIEKSLYFKGGNIVFASSSYEGDRLGEMLLKAGKINLQQFEAASKVIKATGKRIGGVLVELGFLVPKDLFWGVKHQVREIIYSLFDWTEGEYRFYPGDIPSGEVITLHMSTANLILRGVKRINDWTRVSRGMPPMGAVLKVTADPLKLYQDVDLTGDEKRVISLFDGKRTIKEVLALAKAGDFEALKAVHVFYSIGVLEEAEGGELRQDGPAASVGEPGTLIDRISVHKAFIDSKSQNHYELLGLDSEASQKEIEAAYQKYARVYHPDQQFKDGMEQLKDELEELFSKVKEAHAILSDDSRRWEYDLSLATVMSAPGRAEASRKGKPKNPAKARDAFLKGVKNLKAKDFESATVKFKEAARLDSTNPEYFSHLALTLLQRPKREAEAEEAMLKAIELEPGNAGHYANLGLLYQKAGLKEKARESFDAALRLEPKNPKALKALGIKK